MEGTRRGKGREGEGRETLGEKKEEEVTRTSSATWASSLSLLLSFSLFFLFFSSEGPFWDRNPLCWIGSFREFGRRSAEDVKRGGLGAYDHRIFAYGRQEFLIIACSMEGLPWGWRGLVLCPQDAGGQEGQASSSSGRRVSENGKIKKNRKSGRLISCLLLFFPDCVVELS